MTTTKHFLKGKHLVPVHDTCLLLCFAGSHTSVLLPQLVLIVPGIPCILGNSSWLPLTCTEAHHLLDQITIHLIYTNLPRQHKHHFLGWCARGKPLMETAAPGKWTRGPKGGKFSLIPSHFICFPNALLMTGNLEAATTKSVVLIS